MSGKIAISKSKIRSFFNCRIPLTIKIVFLFQITVSGSQEGAFENIKLNFTGDQGQTLRGLVNARVVQHKAMCLLASPQGKRHQMAIAHDKGKVCQIFLF